MNLEPNERGTFIYNSFDGLAKNQFGGLPLLNLDADVDHAYLYGAKLAVSLPFGLRVGTTYSMIKSKTLYKN